MSEPLIFDRILWLLAHAHEECGAPGLTQFFEDASGQMDTALNRLIAEGLIREDPATQRYSLTANGLQRQKNAAVRLRREEPDALHVRLLDGCEGDVSAPLCQECLERLRALLAAADMAGAALCLELMFILLERWVQQHETDWAWFPDAICLTHDAAVFMMKRLETSYACLTRAKELLRRTGNIRRLALLELATGYSRFFSGSNLYGTAMEGFQQGIALLNSLRDKDIYLQATPYLLVMHYAAGRFHRALEYHEALQRAPQSAVLPFMEDIALIEAASSAAYLGHFAHARGILKSAIALAEISGKHILGLIYKVHFGVMLAYMRECDEAMSLLQAVAAQVTPGTNPKMALRAYAAMAFCLLRMDELDKAHAVLAEAISAVCRQQSFSITFNYPWALELAVSFHLHGLSPLPGLDIDLLARNMRDSSNSMLQGLERRFQAQLARQRGEPLDALLHLQDNGLELLRRAQTPVECGYLQLERADTLRQLGKTAEAEQAVGDARQLLASLTRYKQASPAPDKDETALLERCYQQLSALDCGESIEHFSSQIAYAARELLQAERVAVLVRRTGGIQCLGACSFSPHELEHDAFRTQRELVARQMDSGQPCFRTSHGLDALCLPFTVNGTERWMLYVDSSAGTGHLLRCGPGTLRELAHFFMLEFRSTLRLLDSRRLDRRARDLQALSDLKDENKNQLWGDSEPFKRCLEQARIVAATEATILLLGETGVGKEALAHFIHAHSRCTGPLVAVHPASISENLFESELFGHEKGSFTGAVRQKIGLIELADKGTLFIDELGDVPMGMQTKLLRVLQEHTFMRVGGMRELHSSFRLLGATNVDLAAAVKRGTFREDLYYRVSVVPLYIPPLRERQDDITTLVLHFIKVFARRYARTVPPPDSATLEKLRGYFWPGNIRELKNTVERAVILYQGGPLTFDMGLAPTETAPPADSALPAGLAADMPSMREVEKRYIQRVLRHTQGRISGPGGAEQILGMKRSTLYLRLQQYGIKPKDNA